MSARSLRILCQIDWPNTAVVSRLWDGAGPFLYDEDIWQGCALVDGLDAIESAFNGEASTLALSLIGVGRPEADLAWLDYTNDQIIGATVRLMLLQCGATDQPVGSAETRFTGTIDNVLFNDKVEGDRPKSTITVEVTNRFTLRRLTHGAVLSDPDQRARSAVLNPGANPDRFCERIPLMADHSIVWPRFN